MKTTISFQVCDSASVLGENGTYSFETLEKALEVANKKLDRLPALKLEIKKITETIVVVEKLTRRT